MEKINNLVNRNHLWLLLGSYFILVLFSLILFPTEVLFLKLGAVGVADTFIGIVMCCSVLWFLTEYKKILDIRTINIVLVALILFFAILKSPSLFLSLGLSLISITLFVLFYIEKERLAIAFPLLVVLSSPKLILQAGSNFKDEALGIYSFNIAESRFSVLIWPILTAVLIAIIVGIVFSRLETEKISKVWIRWFTLFILVCGVSYVLYLSVVVYYKVKANAVSTYDLGIFSQMFERMKTDFTQITTLERDKVLSHFAVHISPIFYLILPVYMLFPYVETLEVMQVLIVFSGVIPLCLILKKLQLPKLLNPLLLALFFVTPVMTTSGGFRIHENCFLPPLILWLFYAIISQWRWRTLLFSILVLMVKEDAFIYVLSIGLYFTFQNRFIFSAKFKKWLYISCFGLTILYTGLALFLLSKYGEGAMASRYGHLLLNGEQGLSKIVKNLVFNPVYVLGSLFTAKRLGYIFLVLISFSFLPLIQRRFSAYFLAIPLLAVNLLSDWFPQYDIGYQYSYGSVTLIFIMGLLAVDQLSKNKVIKEKFLAALVMSSIVFSSTILYTLTHDWNFEVKYYQQQKSFFEGVQSVLNALPKKASVLSVGPYTPSLRKHEKLYDIDYHNDKKVDPTIDFVVVQRQLRNEKQGHPKGDLVKAYEAAGYKESNRSTEFLLVLEK